MTISQGGQVLLLKVRSGTSAESMVHLSSESESLWIIVQNAKDWTPPTPDLLDQAHQD